MKKFLIAAAIATLCLTGCDTNTDNVGFDSIKEVQQEFGTQSVRVATMDRDPESMADYFYMEIEKMPCVVYYPTSTSGGLSCDWSKWEGKTFDETLVPVRETYKAPVKVDLPFFAKDEYPDNVVSKDQPVMTPYARGEHTQ